MISLQEIAKSINEDPRGVDNIDRSKGAEKKDQDADRVGRDDGDTWMAPNGDYGGKYKGEIEYFDDEDSAKVYAKSGSTDSKGGEEKPEEPKGNIGKGDFDRDSDDTAGDPDDSWDDEEGRAKPTGKNKFGVDDDQFIGQTDWPHRDVTVKQALAYDGDNGTMKHYKKKAQGIIDTGDFKAYGVDPNHPKGGSPNAKAAEPKDEPKGDEEPKKLSPDEIDKKVDDLGKEIFSVYHSMMSPQDQERYIDDLQKQIDDLKSQKESIKVIDGKKYKAVKEDRADGKKIVGYRFAGKTYKNKADAPVADPTPVYESKESNKRVLKEIYDRTFRSLK